MENALKEKSFALAVGIVKLSQYLSKEKREFVLSKQILRSGTSIGALYREAEHAESKADLQGIISRGKSQAVSAVNSTLTLTYWHVGKRINDEVLHGERAAYGKQLIASVAKRLVELHGKSFVTRKLRRMMQFAELFPDLRIVSPLVTQLSET